ncbi:hypothetical protein PSTG_11051 [Puccinia striiformis f. sp. tritici PST-78]|uniref:Uncharacterized protein n=1 Tax=Puccinia striiformis f. sp. tritici PST-78 TaxID=1165861 RepID=A0A0L0V8S2_9BASI|nr:hypothetical protein PSTG_11051 [Puccinia striiformis f. sp. tritici PST-78]
MLGYLSLPPEQEDIFAEPTCCSDTEQMPDGTFKRIECSWRSASYSELGHELDKLFERHRAEKLGQRYNKHGVSVWLLRQASNMNLLQVQDAIDLQAIIQKVSTS